MTKRLLGVVVCLLAATACGKKKDEGQQVAPAEKTAEAVAAESDRATGKTGANDPWAAPPPTANVKFGAHLGDDLAKIDPKHEMGGGRLAMAAKKIELGSVAKPSESSVALKAFGKIEATGFSVTYNESKNAVHEQYRVALQEGRVFEEVVESLNKTVRMPKTVDIQVVDCGTINAFYDPNSSRIIVCYELLDYFLSVFKGNTKSDDELGNAVIGATMFSFFHEAGHGLIHQLDLPAVGREEDSVDQLATLILIAGGDGGVSMALSGAYWFQLQAKKSEHQTPFWDEHAFDGQRFYNIMCLIYGSDPTKYAEFVTSGNLPHDRARRCPEEYAKINKAWEKLLQPHLTNGAALNIDYKPSIPQAEAPKQTAPNNDPWADPAPAQTPAAPEQPAPPAGNAITCEQVATKAAELIAVEAQVRAQSMSPEEVKELEHKLEAELPAVIETILAECAKADWSEASRKCVLASKTLAQASNCN